MIFYGITRNETRTTMPDWIEIKGDEEAKTTRRIVNLDLVEEITEKEECSVIRYLSGKELRIDTKLIDLILSQDCEEEEEEEYPTHGRN
jgi:hypothetical protein